MGWGEVVLGGGGKEKMGKICNIVNNNKKNSTQESWCGDLGNTEGSQMCMASSGGGRSSGLRSAWSVRHER